MGFLWDLIQQGQISETKTAAETLEKRVAELEGQMADMRRIMRILLERLEQRFGEDIDRDGKIG